MLVSSRRVYRKAHSLLCLILLLAGGAAAESFWLPGATLVTNGDALTLRYRSIEATYVRGLGWLNGWPGDPPVASGDGVIVDEQLLAWLAVDLPRLAGLRIAGETTLRIVLDLPELAPQTLTALQGSGKVASGDSLELALPELLLPVELADPGFGIELVWSAGPGRTTLQLITPAVHYEVTALAEPTRLVIDLTPTEPRTIVEIDEELRPGVRYRHFSFANGFGSSAVHALAIAPGVGEFRVVGENRVPHTLSELASGAFAAINGGYFDPASFAAIGLLKIDHGLLSIPSRNRASLSFDGEAVEIDRVTAEVEVVAAGRSVFVDTLGSNVSLHTSAGATVGSPRLGVIEVRDALVLANRVGPRSVPDGGMALVYAPELRSLAAVDAGTELQVNVAFEPRSFSFAGYALEAGPLLVQDGRAAFAPEREGFQRGARILDATTQQAAVGVLWDGTVLFVVAETMTAEELVPLFLELGARAAMRLDSGSSAGLLVDGDLLNRRHERAIVTALVWIAPEP